MDGLGLQDHALMRSGVGSSGTAFGSSDGAARGGDKFATAGDRSSWQLVGAALMISISGAIVLAIMLFAVLFILFMRRIRVRAQVERKTRRLSRAERGYDALTEARVRASA